MKKSNNKDLKNLNKDEKKPKQKKNNKNDGRKSTTLLLTYLYRTLFYIIRCKLGLGNLTFIEKKPL